MTAEELLELIKEAKNWDIHKINMVFEGYGVHGFLENFGVDKFVEKVEDNNRLTINDLEVGDIIERGATRYVVLTIDWASRGTKGAYVMTNEERTRYVVDSDIAGFKKTQLSVEYNINIIKTLLKGE